MTWQDARRLTVESDKRGDDFFEARKVWLSECSSEALEKCVEHAARYGAALDAEIECLKALSNEADAATALQRALMYKRLLGRQIQRIQKADATADRPKGDGR